MWCPVLVLKNYNAQIHKWCSLNVKRTSLLYPTTGDLVPKKPLLGTGALWSLQPPWLARLVGAHNNFPAFSLQNGKAGPFGDILKLQIVNTPTNRQVGWQMYSIQ